MPPSIRWFGYIKAAGFRNQTIVLHASTRRPNKEPQHFGPQLQCERFAPFLSPYRFTAKAVSQSFQSSSENHMATSHGRACPRLMASFKASSKASSSRHTFTSLAIIAAVAAMCAGTSQAESSITIYGTLDVAVDRVNKGQGDIGGTFFQSLPANIHNAALADKFNSAFANKTSVSRVTPSVAAQSALGFKGIEELSGGYKAGFVLEGQFSADTGAQNGQDSRMWGRQAYVGLTTPYGEVRLGRQYAPIFYAYAFNSVESIGASDLMASGLIVNNLQIRQDNQLSYWIKQGGLTAALAYSPNAGVDKNVSLLRTGQAIAGSANGQIIGGASAGTETADSGARGQSIGMFLNYRFNPSLLINGGFHANKFGDAKLVEFATGTPLMSLDKYIGYTAGLKFTVPDVGTMLGANVSQGRFTNDAGSVEGAKVQTFALGVKHPIDNLSVGAEASLSKFTNFTHGKDTALMLTADYRFSKRTMVYARGGYLKDQRGRLADTDGRDPVTHAVMQMAGGPAPLLVGLGSAEVPFFAGGGANIGARTSVIALGIRHDF